MKKSHEFNKYLILLHALGFLFFLSGCGGKSESALAASDETVAGLLMAPLNESQAVRFLYKSSFGPTASTVDQLRRLGYTAFVDYQMGLPAGRYNPYMMEGYGGYDNVTSYCTNFPNESVETCRSWNIFNSRPTSVLFFRSAVHDEDQLRLRVAWALSQILVVSTQPDKITPYGMRIYQQLLRDNAFSNFREILLRVTLNPTMGSFLDLANSHQRIPNQNYARELLQLFSVGTYKRNDDGTFVWGADGLRQENYTEQDVQSFARALTGWTYPSGFQSGEMVEVAANHDSGSKALLNGAGITSGKTARQELELVIDNIFNHPSTGPNIVRQLIQLLVTSNPSPAYVKRVVSKFNNNGQGVRGDMRAVVRAILLDQEALSPPDYAGRLMEPVITLTSLLRAVGGSTDGASLDTSAATMDQRPFAAPSVFNFYPPDYALPMSNGRLQAPQFAIVTTGTVIKRMNALRKLIFTDVIAPDTSLPKYIDANGSLANGTRLVWPTAWVDQASNPGSLVDTLNVQLTGGILESSQRSKIVAVLQNLASTTSSDKLNRVRYATWLILSSPQFSTQR